MSKARALQDAISHRLLNGVFKMLKKLLALASAFYFLLMGFMGSAVAALPASVTTDLAAAKSDIVEVGTIVIGLAVAVAAIFWVKKPIR
ncbi:MAG TPA: major capsid protein [Nitrosomonas sp.]|nr:major capsid protein [Nitrosomonas sp.]